MRTQKHGLQYFVLFNRTIELHSGLFLGCPKTYDLYAVCVSGLNRLIPRHLSESRVVYGQAVNGPLMAVRATEALRNPWGINIKFLGL